MCLRDNQLSGHFPRLETLKQQRENIYLLFANN